MKNLSIILITCFLFWAQGHAGAALPQHYNLPVEKDKQASVQIFTNRFVPYAELSGKEKRKNDKQMEFHPLFTDSLCNALVPYSYVNAADYTVKTLFVNYKKQASDKKGYSVPLASVLFIKAKNGEMLNLAGKQSIACFLPLFTTYWLNARKIEDKINVLPQIEKIFLYFESLDPSNPLVDYFRAITYDELRGIEYRKLAVKYYTASLEKFATCGDTSIVRQRYEHHAADRKNYCQEQVNIYYSSLGNGFDESLLGTWIADRYDKEHFIPLWVFDFRPDSLLSGELVINLHKGSAAVEKGEYNNNVIPLFIGDTCFFRFERDLLYKPVLNKYYNQLNISHALNLAHQTLITSSGTDVEERLKKAEMNKRDFQENILNHISTEKTIKSRAIEDFSVIKINDTTLLLNCNEVVEILEAGCDTSKILKYQTTCLLNKIPREPFSIIGNKDLIISNNSSTNGIAIPDYKKLHNEIDRYLALKKKNKQPDPIKEKRLVELAQNYALHQHINHENEKKLKNYINKKKTGQTFKIIGIAVGSTAMIAGGVAGAAGLLGSASASLLDLSMQILPTVLSGSFTTISINPSSWNKEMLEKYFGADTPQFREEMAKKQQKFEQEYAQKQALMIKQQQQSAKIEKKQTKENKKKQKNKK